MTEMMKTENPIRLTKAGHLFLTNPCERTLIRWSRIGLGGVKLETFMTGGYRYTTVQACQRFIEQTTK